jgi:glycosyltransferase involved in cell wall biosynthesis
MRPLKIALLSRWYWEEHRRAGVPEGGMVQQLAEAVAALGHEVVVLSQSPEVRKLEKAQVGALETWLSPRDKKRDLVTGLRDKWAKRTYKHRKVHTDALALRDFLAKRGPFDLLWAQCEEPDGLVAAIAAQRGIALPPILTQIHALRYRFENGAPVFTEKPALGLAFRHATRIIANSELVARALTHYTGRGLTAEQLAAKVRVVHPNLTRDFLAAREESPSGLGAERRRVLFFGALNETKGALIFVESYQKTAAAKTPTTFVVVGGLTEKNPEFTQRWEAALKAARGRLTFARLEFLGKLPVADVIRQIQRATVVVVPSLFDAFSRAVVESLILGRPVITTDQVGAAPLVEANDCGFVIPANNSDELARAIDFALESSAPYAANAKALAPTLLADLAPSTVALQLAYHFAETISG